MYDNQDNYSDETPDASPAELEAMEAGERAGGLHTGAGKAMYAVTLLAIQADEAEARNRAGEADFKAFLEGKAAKRLASENEQFKFEAAIFAEIDPDVLATF